MKYLVTGGAGFIGANVVEQLLAVGHTVTVLDDLSLGKRERVPEAVTFLQGSITDPAMCAQACAGQDGVFHLAAIPRMPYSIEKPFETNEVNVDGTLRMLIAARDAGVKRFVFSSSSSIYGPQDTMPFVETMTPHPLSPYGLQKCIGEGWCTMFSQLYKLPTVALRYFNVYGGKWHEASGSYPLVTALFIKQRKEGKPLTLTGDGQYRRDFTHVTDVAAANILAMESQNIHGGEIFNIGAGNNASVKDVADMIGGPTEFIPERVGDPRETLANNSLAKQIIGWEPQMKLADGIAELKQLAGIV